MSDVIVELVAGPLPDQSTRSPSVIGGGSQSAGAVVIFDGLVRPTELGRPILALNYESYEPMTSRMLKQLAQELVHAHRLISIHVIHSIGEVPNHRVSFRLTICAAHRKEALNAMDLFINRMKAEIPLWKTPVWAT